MVGRFAPSPTGELHLGSLRTALVAWLAARSRGDGFVVRVEDLDPVASSDVHEASQLRDLAALGVTWDGPVLHQSDRTDIYLAALDRLTAAGATYECFCTRREIREAVAAPHGTPLEYPGTCRALSSAERERRRAIRPPAIRLRAGDDLVEFHDAVAGIFRGRASDVVLRRYDGVPAYNLAVVVDDAAQGIDEVVRGDDLLDTTPSQIALQRLLGVATPSYAHVPLVVGPTGERLAKRDGAVSLVDLAASGFGVDVVRSALLASLDLVAPGTYVGIEALAEIVQRFELAHLRRLGRRPIPVHELLADCSQVTVPV